MPHESRLIFSLSVWCDQSLHLRPLPPAQAEAKAKLPTSRQELAALSLATFWQPVSPGDSYERSRGVVLPVIIGDSILRSNGNVKYILPYGRIVLSIAAHARHVPPADGGAARRPQGSHLKLPDFLPLIRHRPKSGGVLKLLTASPQ